MNHFDMTSALRESNAIEGVFDERSLELAKEAWEYLYLQDAITFTVILKTHRLLMREHLPENEAGEWRGCPVWIGGRKALQFSQIVPQMKRWVDDNRLKDADPRKLHIRYEHIHPFVDGNGRTGRMFMWWLETVKLKKEPTVIYESNRQEYYKWFK